MITKETVLINNQEHNIIHISEDSIKISLSSFGAGIFKLETKDRAGDFESVILTPSNYFDYVNCSDYYGLTLGPTAGRIWNGCFSIDAEEYRLDCNWKNLANLHGGYNSLSNTFFDYSIIEDENFIFVLFSTRFKGQFPGSLDVKVSYIISRNLASFKIKYEAKTNKATLCNLSNHTYFNLSGDLKRNVLDEKLTMRVKSVGSYDGFFLNGFKSVEKDLDFNQGKLIGESISSLYNTELKGYDHTFCLEENDSYQKEISLYDELSGRFLRVNPSTPMVTIYTYNYFENINFNEHRFLAHDGVAIECSYIPSGETRVLRPDEKYEETVCYDFSVK